MENQTKTNRTLTGAARLLSFLFNPFTIPTIAFLVLFLFSYLRIMSLQYKLIVTGIVFCFTVFMPLLTIYLYSRMHKLSFQELGERNRRYMPYIFSLISYIFCLFMMHRLNIPWYMTGVIMASSLIQVIFLIMNLKWKPSEHMGGIGAVIGGLVSFSSLFGYNPVAWLCVLILIAGFLGSSRMILGYHKLSEVLVAFAIGLVCSILVLHPVSNLFFRLLLS